MALNIDEIRKTMQNPEKIRNIAVIAHIHHGKTTFSDALLAGAGVISSDLAGARVLDFREDEQERQMTIDSANISMLCNNQLINMIDTPGHVDFGGDVARAMRAVDGAIVLVCAVEGVMPQTEAVLRQALKEKVRPVLFINKVDRIMQLMKPEQIRQRFQDIVAQVNEIISGAGCGEWNIKNVCYGSAVHRWASTGSLKEIISSYQSDDYAKLAKQKPLYDTVVRFIAEHLPSPREAQKYRIPVIWKGDMDTDVGKSMAGCDSSGKKVFAATQVEQDAAAGRVFSGEIKKGDVLLLNRLGKKAEVRQVFLFRGRFRSEIDSAPAGNIVGVSVEGITSGETMSEEQMTLFEELRHAEPVVKKSVEARKPSELPMLVSSLKQAQKEDPCLQIEINEETGEHLVSGMGELHIEVALNRIQSENNIEIITGPPIIAYREGVTKKGKYKGELSFTAEPADGRENVFVDKTGKNNHNVILAFEDVMKSGPLAAEQCSGIRVTLTEFGNPKDIYSEARKGISEAVLDAEPALYEPVQKMQFEAPVAFTRQVSGLVQKKKGQIIGMKHERGRVVVIAKLPFSQCMGLSNELRGATEGRAMMSLIEQSFEKVPSEFQDKILKQIREKKGITFS
jgi:elongation factor 2